MFWLLMLFVLMPVAGDASGLCPDGFEPVEESDVYVILSENDSCPSGYVAVDEYAVCGSENPGAWCYVMEQVRELCAAGITKLNLSGGLSFPLYSDKSTSPSLAVQYNDTVCYMDLGVGRATGAINVEYNNVVYHTVQ